MATKNVDIPFAYGNLISVTPGRSPMVQLWFADPSGIIRGVTLDLSDPSAPKTVPESEVVIRRRTEGQTRRRKGSLPPIAATLEKK